MTFDEKYGNEYGCQPFTFKNKDGVEKHCHDIWVCITPKENTENTLRYAYDVFRELTQHTCESFRHAAPSNTYRVVLAWSKSVRARQGHILKVWESMEEITKVTAFATVEDCAAYFGSTWLPFQNWQKDVFKKK